ncbi:hypothetical protein SAY86_010839 [Trapa natans]|uniref:Protein LNK2 n=1 Tax=Trapa natans TaxID=22666 RepID=A0AAN7R4K6_TRANT|nr:hypothetical protein SAY86_010839 [Trapa natans]
MFDWSEEEIANIIWDEDGEGDDHRVPLPGDGKDSSDKSEQNQESAAKLTGVKAPGVKRSFGNAKQESISTIDKKRRRSSEVSMNSWPDLSTSSFTKNVQGALTSESTDDLSETAKYDSYKGVLEKAQTVRDHQAFENPQDGEQNAFVDYGWENIGSFDDLNRIFSQDEPLFSNVLSNTDGLWCPKDVTSISLRSLSMSGDSLDLGLEVIPDASEIRQLKAENEKKDDGSHNLLCVKLDDPPSLNIQHVSALPEHAGHCRGQIKHPVKEQSNFSVADASAATSHLTANNSLTHKEYSDKVSRQKKHYKEQKKQGRKNEEKMPTVFYGAWSSTGNMSGQYEHQYQLAAPVRPSCVPSAMNQMAQHQGIDSFQFQHMPNQYLQAPACGKFLNPFPPSLFKSPILEPEKFMGQDVVSQCEISPREINTMNRQFESSDRSTMTPQEKIEKLRRRQQMRAMLAIQKQQEQFNDQAPSYSIAQKGPIQRVQRLDGADFGLNHMSTLPLIDTSSAVDQHGSNTTSMTVFGYDAEDSVLHQLQDVIDKLDSRMKLCIRDSLLRLAKSALQRQYTSYTSSINTRSKDETEGGPSKEDTYLDNRHVLMPDIETETNPVDRAVAHLLFHRPLESSVKHHGSPDLPVSTKLPAEIKTSNATNLFIRPLGYQPD